jgi:hypothetical protein
MVDNLNSISRSAKLVKPCSKDFENKQLDLFQTFVENDQGDHSNLIELWDAVPKFHINKRKQNALRNADGFLPTYNYNFVHRGRSFDVKISPARIETSKGDKEYYPGTREELVEDALRKIACAKDHAYLKESRSGVTFSLYRLRQELAETGHTFSFQELQESLEIMNSCSIGIQSIVDDEHRMTLRTSILPNLISVTRESHKDNWARSKWYADFASLVTESIHNNTFRQYNYKQMMTFPSQLERWLYKRLAHNYVQASLDNKYNIKLSSIQRDSGLLLLKQIRHQMRKLNDVLETMIKKKILISYEIDPVKEKRKLLDVHYALQPHPEFINEIKASNLRTKQLSKK